MAIFEFEITLVSELNEYSPNRDDSFSDSVEYFDYLFLNFGGTGLPYDAIPCWNPATPANVNESVFANLDWNFESEPPTVEGSVPRYEIASISGTQESGWTYFYRFLVPIFVRVTARTLEEALAQLQADALEHLAIFDGGVEEIVSIKEVRLALV